MRKTVIIFYFLMSFLAQGQDVHFSQFYNSPLTINPANVGAFNGDIRAHSNYRNQWSSIQSAYKTYSFSEIEPFIELELENLHFTFNGSNKLKSVKKFRDFHECTE